jgi:hypothetical protein
MKRKLTRSVIVATIGLFAGIAHGEDVMSFGDSRLLSTTDAGEAFKVKLVRLSYGTPHGFARSLVAVYGEAAGPEVWLHRGETRPARDIYMTRSTDDGATWSAPLNLSRTALLFSTRTDHDGRPETPARPYYGDSGKPNIFSSGKSIVVSWVDRFCPTTEQRTVRYPEFGNIEIPYAALYAVRSNDGGATWSAPQRMTDGYRDAIQNFCRGNGEGWMIVWQEDPQGLQPGDAEGPGDGCSGAKVSKGTDVWTTSLAASAVRAGVPFPPARRVTDNFTQMGEGEHEGYEYGQTGASRPNLALVGRTAIVAYEETKGLGGLDFGKYVRYHVFSAFDDAMPDVTQGAGWIISTPNENARRVRFVAKGTPGPDSGLSFLIFYKQGEYDQGGPSDILLRAGFGGCMPEHLVPAVHDGCTTREGAFGNEPALNMSSSLGLEAESGLNPFEDARAHRAIVRGDFIALGYSWTPNWAVARYTDLENYDFYVRRSLDGGVTWDEPRNMSGLADTKVNVLEPRIVPTPKTPDPDDVQNKNVFFVAWATEVNQYEHVSEGSIPLDVFVTRTTDKGATYEPIQRLAGGAPKQSASQLRSNGAGDRLSAVWNEQDESAHRSSMFRAATAIERIVGDVVYDGIVDALDLVAVLRAFGSCHHCPADLDDDGVVDVTDLQIVLANWS